MQMHFFEEYSGKYLQQAEKLHFDIAFLYKRWVWGLRWQLVIWSFEIDFLIQD